MVERNTRWSQKPVPKGLRVRLPPSAPSIRGSGWCRSETLNLIPSGFDPYLPCHLASEADWVGIRLLIGTKSGFDSCQGHKANDQHDACTGQPEGLNPMSRSSSSVSSQVRFVESNTDDISLPALDCEPKPSKLCGRVRFLVGAPRPSGGTEDTLE